MTMSRRRRDDVEAGHSRSVRAGDNDRALQGAMREGREIDRAKNVSEHELTRAMAVPLMRVKSLGLIEQFASEGWSSAKFLWSPRNFS
jgi:hypothetical protein